MKITSLGYAPINQTNQNCASNQQNPTAFKGKFLLIAPEKVARRNSFANAWGKLISSFLEKAAKLGEKINLKFDTIIQDGQRIHSLSFDTRFDTQGREAVEEFQKSGKYSSQKITAKFSDEQ